MKVYITGNMVYKARIEGKDNRMTRMTSMTCRVIKTT